MMDQTVYVALTILWHWSALMVMFGAVMASLSIAALYSIQCKSAQDASDRTIWLGLVPGLCFACGLLAGASLGGAPWWAMVGFPLMALAVNFAINAISMVGEEGYCNDDSG